MITKKIQLSLKQMGYSSELIESILSRDSEIPLKALVNILDKKQPTIRHQRTFSLGWKPSQLTFKKLNKAGYLTITINNYAIEFIYEISEAKRNPACLDSYFIACIKRKIEPIKICMLKDWIPEQQIGFAASHHAISSDRLKQYINLYRLKIDDNHECYHGSEFYKFMSGLLKNNIKPIDFSMR